MFQKLWKNTLLVDYQSHIIINRYDLEVACQQHTNSNRWVDLWKNGVNQKLKEYTIYKYLGGLIYKSPSLTARFSQKLNTLYSNFINSFT